MLERQPAPLGEPLGDALDPELRDPGEQAGRALGDREVGDVAEVAVEAWPASRRVGPALPRGAMPVPRSAATTSARPRRATRARIIPKAERSMPTGRSPALRIVSTSVETCRAARRRRRPRSGPRRPRPCTWPTTSESRTAWSSGIGIWSWAWKRIAVSSSSRSRSPAAAGSGPRPAGWRCRAGRSSKACARRKGPSAPLRGRRGRRPRPRARLRAASGSDAVRRRRAREPFARTSVAAMLPASISRPTSLFALRRAVIIVESRTGARLPTTESAS